MKDEAQHRPRRQSSEAMNDVGTQLQLRPHGRPARKPRPRLDDDAYVGRHTYHVTLSTSRRNPVFENVVLGRQCVDQLEDAAAKTNFNILAFCFMPDHAHLLAQGQSSASNLIAFVQRFKQTTGFAFKQKTGLTLWQAGFFDRVLRKTDEPDAVSDYILNNPLQDGFALEHPAYVLRGGAYYERDVRGDGAEAASLHGSSLRSTYPYVRSPEVSHD